MASPAMKVFEEDTPTALQDAFNAWVIAESPDVTYMKTELGYRAEGGVGKFFMVVTWSTTTAPPLTIRLPLEQLYTNSVSPYGWYLVNIGSPMGPPKGLMLTSISDGLSTVMAQIPISYLLSNGDTISKIKVYWQPGVGVPDTAKLTMSLWSDDGTGLNYATNHGSVEQDAVNTYHTKEITGLSQTIDRGNLRHYITLTSALNMAAPASDYVCGIDISYT